MTKPDGGIETGEPSPEAGPAGPSARSHWSRWLLEWVAIVVVAGVVALLLRAFVVEPYKIPSGSMEPTLRVNDRVLVDKLSYDMHSVHRGDVIVFKKPADDNSPGVTDLIKRVIGLPGETISLENGQIYIDDKRLDQKWLPAEGITDPGPVITNLGCANTGATVDFCVIPKGDYYVMGDNRDDSDDSRFFGPIPGKLIIGRTFMIIWPIGHIGTL